MIVIEHGSFGDFVLCPFFITAHVPQVTFITAGDMKLCEFGKHVLLDAKCLCVWTVNSCQMCRSHSVKVFLHMAKIILLACVQVGNN